MESTELSKELEKAARCLSKMRKNIIISEEESFIRKAIVRAAIEENKDYLREICQKVVSEENGAKHILRALNNCAPIYSRGSLIMAEALFQTVKADLDAETRAKKLATLLKAIAPDLDGDAGWLANESFAIMDELCENSDDASVYLYLWTQHCAAHLRTTADSDTLIRELAHRRLTEMPNEQRRKLKNDLNDAKADWSIRAASLYALVGMGEINLEKARDFLDDAYNHFPLEALAAVESLSIAVEFDGSRFAEDEYISDKICQLCEEGATIRQLSRETFERESHRLFESFAELPAEAMAIAERFASASHDESLMLAALLKDLQRSDWLSMARRYKLTLALSCDFFAHFVAANPFVVTMAGDILLEMQELYNISALDIERWDEAVAEENESKLAEYAKNWLNVFESFSK